MILLFCLGGALDTHLPSQLNSSPALVTVFRMPPRELDCSDLNLSTQKVEGFLTSIFVSVFLQIWNKCSVYVTVLGYKE